MEEREDQQSIGKESLSFYAQSSVSNTFRFYLDETIREPSYYRDMIQQLVSAQEDDFVQVFINSHGGRFDATQSIIEGIKLCMAPVQSVIMADCHSGASMVALACDDVIVLDSANMMIHTASGGHIGKFSDIRKEAEFSLKQMDRTIETAYEGFLSEEEIEAVKSGEDFWFDAEEIKARLEARDKLREEQLKAVEAEIESREEREAEKVIESIDETLEKYWPECKA